MLGYQKSHCVCYDGTLVLIIVDVGCHWVIGTTRALMWVDPDLRQFCDVVIWHLSSVQLRRSFIDAKTGRELKQKRLACEAGPAPGDAPVPARTQDVRRMCRRHEDGCPSRKTTGDGSSGGWHAISAGTDGGRLSGGAR